MKYTKRGSGPLSLPPRNSCEAQGNPARPPGIEGVEMRKVYYNLVPRAALRIPLAAIGLLGSFGGAQQPPLRTASLESHEGLTISATPWTDAAKYKEKFPKKSPYSAGILAVQVSFRNDSDDSVKVNLSRIRLTVHLDAENAQEASVPTGVIAPHSTVQGLVYFDLQNQFDLLDTAHLYVPDLVLMRGNRALTYFDIDLGQRGN